MSNNRELSQLASLITVDDSDRSLGINTSVGIGTTNPTSRLHVVGDTLITGIATVNSNLIVNGNTLVADATNNRIGIGTTNPNYTLEVNGGIGATTLVVTGVSTFAGITTNTSTLFANQLSVAGVSTFAGITTNTSTLFANQLSVAGVSTHVGISTFQSTLFANQLSVAGVSTHVGISTFQSTLFANQLSVAGVSTFTNGPVLIGAATSTGTASQRLQVTGGAYVSGSVGIGTTNPLGTLQVNSGTSAVVVTGIGSVSIGATIPLAKFYLDGGANNYTPSNSGTGLFEVRGGTSTYLMYIGIDDQGGYFGHNSSSRKLFFDVNETTRMTIDTSGNVGIATINPLGRLQVGAASTQSFVVTSTGSVGIGTTNPTGILNLRGYTGGSSAVSAYNKTFVIGGVYNQSYNTGNSVLMHIADYSNDASDDVYPIYCEDENNIVDFWINAGNTQSGSSKKAYFGGSVGIGAANPLGRLQVGVAGTSVFVVTSTGGVGIGTTSTVIGVGNSFYDGTKLHVVNTIDNASTEGAYSVVIDTYMNGTQTPPAADAEQAGLLVHTKSDVTSGTTTNEHQAIGIYNVLRVNGDSDAVYAAYNNPVLNHTSGTVSNYFGCYNLAESTATSTISNYYGTYSLAQPISGSGTIGDLVGIRARTNTDGGTATATDIFAVWANIDNDAATTQSVSGTCALYYGNYDVTTGLTNPYGVYIATDAADNYFAGSVGIGTTDPESALDVQGAVRIRDTTANSTFTGAGNLAIKDNISNPFISFHESTGTRNAYIQSQGATGFFIIQEDTLPLTLRTEESQPIVFETNDTEEMRITGAGLVGIGTNAPTTLLHVHEVNSGTTPLVRIQNSNATAANNAILLELFYSGDADVSGAATSAHYIRFRDQNTNPTGQISGSSATAVLYATSSDYRLKEDITPSTNGIERIMQFKPCEFTWKESQVRSEGFIAHEVQEVFPEAVVGSKDAVDEEGNMIPQMIDPAKMVVVLTAALQEAIQRIQYLESVVGIGSS